MEMSGYFHTLVYLSLENNRGTHRIGGRVSPRAGLDVVAKKKTFPAGNRTPVLQPVA
jgi:hypothetical protein